jgi:molybdenum cofactor guanylyltransferase
MGQTNAPIGAVLAGGAGRRIGGGKAIVELHGRPLLAYPVAALRAVLDDVVVVAKPGSELPDLPDGVAVWTEPEQPRHPLAGVVHALREAGGRSVLVAAGDLPFVGRELIERLAGEPAGGAPAVVPFAAGRLQPLLARYEPAALAPLEQALADPRPAPLTDAVAALRPRVIELADDRAFFNVNLPEDLLTATAMMDPDPDRGRSQ